MEFLDDFTQSAGPRKRQKRRFSELSLVLCTLPKKKKKNNNKPEIDILWDTNI